MDRRTRLSISYMSEECNTIWSISHLVITSILMLIALPLLISFIKRYISSDKKLNISLLLILSLFTFETFCAFLFAMYQDIYCVDILPSYAQYDTLEFSQAILVAVYWTQSYFVSLLFYIRLYNVFKGGRHRLSKCTTTIYILAFVCVGVCVPVYFVLWKCTNHRLIACGVFVITSFCLIALNISLVTAFATRLLIFHQIDHSDAKDESSQFLSIVTKITLLVIVSCISTMLSTVFVIVRVIYYSESIHWVTRYLFAVDMFTNLLCVALSYTYLDGHYRFMCKWLDNLCKAYCDQIASVKVASHVKNKSTNPCANYVAV
eukprot:955315_1